MKLTIRTARGVPLVHMYNPCGPCCKCIRIIDVILRYTTNACICDADVNFGLDVSTPSGFTFAPPKPVVRLFDPGGTLVPFTSVVTGSIESTSVLRLTADFGGSAYRSGTCHIEVDGVDCSTAVPGYNIPMTAGIDSYLAGEGDVVLDEKCYDPAKSPTDGTYTAVIPVDQVPDCPYWYPVYAISGGGFPTATLVDDSPPPPRQSTILTLKRRQYTYTNSNCVPTGLGPFLCDVNVTPAPDDTVTFTYYGNEYCGFFAGIRPLPAGERTGRDPITAGTGACAWRVYFMDAFGVASDPNHSDRQILIQDYKTEADALAAITLEPCGTIPFQHAPYLRRFCPQPDPFNTCMCYLWSTGSGPFGPQDLHFTGLATTAYPISYGPLTWTATDVLGGPVATTPPTKYLNPSSTTVPAPTFEVTQIIMEDA